jgi:hypothetical protein
VELHGGVAVTRDEFFRLDRIEPHGFFAVDGHVGMTRARAHFPVPAVLACSGVMKVVLTAALAWTAGVDSALAV